MSAPKAVKFKKKNGNVTVEYESNFDAAQYYLFELSRTALNDVGKLLKKRAGINFYNVFKKHTGKAGKAAAINTKVWSNKNTKFPRLQIGAKAGKGTALRYWFFFQEFGNKKVRKERILTKTANDSIADIIKIESQYLSGLSEEASKLASMVNEGEYGDEDE